MSDKKVTENTLDQASGNASEVAGAEPKSAMVEAVQPAVDQVVEGKTAEKRRQTIGEAVTALTETKNALAALDEKDTTKALDALAQVTGKLELLLARSPRLALAPVDVQTVVHDIFAGTDTIEAILDEAEYALRHGEVQKARHLLSGVASEIVITTTSLPLATYPKAISAVAPPDRSGQDRRGQGSLAGGAGYACIQQRGHSATGGACPRHVEGGRVPGGEIRSQRGGRQALGRSAR